MVEQCKHYIYGFKKIRYSRKFGYMHDDVNHYILNLCILYAKWYIYNSKQFECNNVYFFSFLTILKHKLQTETVVLVKKENNDYGSENKSNHYEFRRRLINLQCLYYKPVLCAWQCTITIFKISLQITKNRSICKSQAMLFVMYCIDFILWLI